MTFLLIVLASVVANHKTTTEAEVLNKIAGILKYTPDKIGAGIVEKLAIMMNETECFNMRF